MHVFYIMNIIELNVTSNKCFFSGMISSQFPTGFQAAQLPGSFGNANFANFRPQYSVPGQNNPSQGFLGKYSRIIVKKY